MPLSGYFVSLNADRTNRGLYCALTVASGFIGMLLASAAVFLLPHIRYALDHLASPENYAYLNEPWRWPFFSLHAIIYFNIFITIRNKQE